MTRVFPLPAPARISSGPLVVSTASRCCGLSWSRKDNAEVAPELMIEFYKGFRIDDVQDGDFRFVDLRNDKETLRRIPGLTHLNWGAYHFCLALTPQAAPESRRRILEVILWIRRS